MNNNRRNFLKILLAGGIVALLGKLLSARFAGEPSDREGKSDLGRFRLSNDKKELIIMDHNGEEILIVDKEK